MPKSKSIDNSSKIIYILTVFMMAVVITFNIINNSSKIDTKISTFDNVANTGA